MEREYWLYLLAFSAEWCGWLCWKKIITVRQSFGCGDSTPLTQVIDLALVVTSMQDRKMCQKLGLNVSKTWVNEVVHPKRYHIFVYSFTGLPKRLGSGCSYINNEIDKRGNNYIPKCIHRYIIIDLRQFAGILVCKGILPVASIKPLKAAK